MTLFERLATAGAGAGKTSVIDPEQHRRSIVRNLRNLLNSRLGTAEAQPDLGVPPPHELLVGYPASANRLLAAIAESVERYEPRLSHVRVIHLPREEGKLELRFRITARMVALGGQSIGLETKVTENGRIECRSQAR
ncbi:MAG: type VI secretion system baseplate subunit TssE [Planctomycetota bacterium]|jgi:type VI secretion system protein|nr:type VI secretion system baseplate subunit TssE [Planctomycetota bacterium]